MNKSKQQAYFWPWIFIIFASGSLITAVVIVVEAVSSNALSLGPEFEVGQGESQITVLIPTELDSFALRFGWAVSSALFLVGVALALFSVSQIGLRVPDVALFSRKMQSFMTARYWAVLFILFVAEILRELLRGRIADAAGIIEMPSGRFSGLQDLGPITSPVLWVTLVLGWVLKQGAAVQAETEDIV